MSRSSIYFRHSGKIDPTGPFHILFWGTLISIIGGLGYGAASLQLHVIPHYFFAQIFAPLIPIGIAVLIGQTVGRSARNGKVRNPSFTFWCGLAFGLLSWYLSWVALSWTLNDFDNLHFVLPKLFSPVLRLSEAGSWTFFGGVTSKETLYLFWTIEVGMFAVISAIVASKIIKTSPYDELSMSWLDHFETVAPLEPIDDPYSFRIQLEAGDFSRLLNLRKIRSRRYKYTELNLVGSKKNPRFKLLTIRTIKKDLNKNGLPVVHENIVAENIVTSKEVNESIKELWSLQPPRESR